MCKNRAETASVSQRAGTLSECPTLEDLQDTSSMHAGILLKDLPSAPLQAKQAPAPTKIFLKQKLNALMKSLITLVALWGSAPFLFSVAACSAAVAALRRRLSPATPTPLLGKTALVTGGKMTKALHTCRHLKAQGCRVVLLETSKYWMVASRWSNCVDRFAIVPIPQEDPEGYKAALLKLVEEEDATIFIPTSAPIASEYDASVLDVLPSSVKAWTAPLSVVQLLDDKTKFCELAELQGLTVPEAQEVRTADDVRSINKRLQLAESNSKFLLKSIAYDSIHRLDLFTMPCPDAKLDAYLAKIPLRPDNPWCVQRFMAGEEYSSWALCDSGEMRCFSVSKAEMSNFNYSHYEYPKAHEWVKRFVKQNRLSGSVCIDFMTDGVTDTPYAIECNPRTSSIITSFHDHPELGKCWTGQPLNGRTLQPLPQSRPVYWLMWELWRAANGGVATKRDALHKIYSGQDAYLSGEDPLPFLMLYLLHIPMLLLRNVLKGGNPWKKIDFCIGKLTEVNGD